jgi:hypothetical protein
MNKTVRHLILCASWVCASLSASFLSLSVAWAEDYTLSDLSFEVTKGQKLLYPVITVSGANLSAGQMRRLFDPRTPDDDRISLVQTLTAAAIDIPTITMTGEVSMVIQSVHMQGVKQGRFDRVAIDSVDGSSQNNGEKLIFKTGALAVEQGDMRSLLTALQNGHIETAVVHFSMFSLVDVRFTHPTFEGPKGQSTGDDIVTMDALTGRIDYDRDLPLKSLFEVKNVQFNPAQGTKLANSFSEFGYNRISISLKGSSHYSPDNQTYVIDDLTLTGVNAGALGLKSVLVRITPDIFQGSNTAVSALLQGQIDSVAVRYDDNGLFGKIVSAVAHDQNKSADVVRREWIGMVNQVIPLMVMGDPVGIKLAQAVSGFINKPQRFDLVLKARGGPIAISDLGGIADPSSFLARVDVDAQALSNDTP